MHRRRSLRGGIPGQTPLDLDPLRPKTAGQKIHHQPPKTAPRLPGKISPEHGGLFLYSQAFWNFLRRLESFFCPRIFALWRPVENNPDQTPLTRPGHKVNYFQHNFGFGRPLKMGHSSQGFKT